MGDVNQLLFVEKTQTGLLAPYLEVGSRNYGSTQNLRTIFSVRGKYVGVDMSAGDGVDVVLDMTQDFEAIDAILEGERFGTVFCMSVLEHCEMPFRMAENLTKLLKPDGQICVSVPFSWQFHGYPSDYWRFTHEGVKKLFPEIVFDEVQSYSVSSQEGDFRSLDEQVGKIPLSSSHYRRVGHPLRAIFAGSLKLFTKAGLLKWLAGHHYLLAPTMISMIGTRRRPAE